jgi:hypothetical protein
MEKRNGNKGNNGAPMSHKEISFMGERLLFMSESSNQIDMTEEKVLLSSQSKGKSMNFGRGVTRLLIVSQEAINSEVGKI